MALRRFEGKRIYTRLNGSGNRFYTLLNVLLEVYLCWILLDSCSVWKIGFVFFKLDSSKTVDDLIIMSTTQLDIYLSNKYREVSV